ncbi:integration host factor subunit beta [Halomonas cerina]|nr:integration host factor subunit beta [Halomonas cerina]
MLNENNTGRVRVDPARTARREPMTKSELIEQIATRQPELSVKEVEAAVRLILDDITDTLADGGRVEIRGFGSFSLHYREPRVGRNPKTGEPVALDGKFVPHFKPGKELREQVDASRALGY